MKVWRRVLASVMALVLAVSLVPMSATDRHTAVAAPAGTTNRFTAEEFAICYSKVLLSAVGKGYEDGKGYAGSYKDNDGHAGTPRDPHVFRDSATFDCFGLVVGALMAMGYDCFSDNANGTGNRIDLNGSNGSNIFRGSNGLFYNHKTGDEIYLHHPQAQYTLKFKFGDIVNIANQTSVTPGTLVFSLPTESGNYTYTEGAFAKNTIGRGSQYGLGHAAVELFYLDRASNDRITPQNASSYSGDQKRDILANSWTRANNVLKAAPFSKDLSGGNVRSTATNGHFIPYLWDARGRGFQEASASEYRKGFVDGHANVQFNTPYSRVWLVDALNNDVGVSVNNNPFGKTSAVTMAVELKPENQRGNIEITKTDAVSNAKLSGAEFTLYEWSEAANAYVVSPNYVIKEDGTTGVYRVYGKSSGDRTSIDFTEDNNACVRVVETKAPTGHSNIDPATGNPYTWDHQFTENGELVSWTFTATNYPDVGIQLIKRDSKDQTALAGAVFTLYNNEACTDTYKVSDANGHSTFTTNSSGQANLQFKADVAKTYYVKETTAPSGYKLDGAIYRITIAAAGTSTITVAKKASGSSSYANVGNTISAENARALTAGKVYVDDDAKPVTFKVHKTGKDSTVLANAVFTLYSSEACTDATRVNDATGHYTFTTNASGDAAIQFTPEAGSIKTYYLKETAAPASYILSNDIYKIVVSKATTAENSVGIAISVKTEGSSSYDPVEEISMANAWAAAGEVDVENKPNGLSIKKVVDNAPEVDRDFYFMIAGPSGFTTQWVKVTVKKNTTTQTESPAALKGIPAGLYTITEVIADRSTTPATTSATFPYDPTNANGSITVPSGSEVTFTATNVEVKKGKLQIQKVVSEKAAAARTFWFYVTGPNDYKEWVPVPLAKDATTGVSDVLEDLDEGEYVIKEVAADQSTDAPTSSVSFPYNTTNANGSITVSSGSEVTFTATNTELPGELKITKTLDKAADSNRTFWFYVTGPNGFKDWTSVTVNEGSTTATKSCWTNLVKGDYVIKEVAADRSTDAPTTSATFPWSPAEQGTVSVPAAGTVTFTANNKIVYGNLQIEKKVDKASKEARDFWFRVTGPSEDNGYQNSITYWTKVTVPAGATSAKSDIQGNLPLGTYTIMEVTGDRSGTRPTSTVDFPFDTTNANGTVSVTVNSTATKPAVFTANNTMDVGKLTIVKSIDKTFNEDKTFWFKIEGPDETMPTWKSITVPAEQLSGSITLENLQIGEYTVTEVIGDQKNDVPEPSVAFPFEVSGTGKVSVTKNNNAEKRIDNKAMVGVIEIEKRLDKAQNKDYTFWFKIEGPDPECPMWVSVPVTAGKKVATKTIDNLLIGDYVVTEVTGNGEDDEPEPDGAFPFVAKSDDKNIKVSKGNTVTSGWDNDEAYGDLVIRKVLPVESSQDHTFWFWISGPGEDGNNLWMPLEVKAHQTENTLTISGLKVGHYTVTEVTGNRSKVVPTPSEYFPFEASTETPGITVEYDKTATTTWKNELITGKLLIKKSVDKALAEDHTFWFMITGPAGNKWVSLEIKAEETNAEVLVEKLEPGDYTVKEVLMDCSDKAPETTDLFPFTVESGDENIVVKPNETVESDWKNKVVTGKTAIKKTLSEASKVDRTFWFYIVGPLGDEYWISTTVKKGDTEATSDELADLIPGKYTVTEVKEKGSTEEVETTDKFPYEASGDTDIVLSPDKLTEADWTNTVQKGSLTITKNVDKAPTKDLTVWFAIIGPEGDESGTIWTSITIKKGEKSASATVNDLIIGSYEVREVVADGSEEAVSITDEFPYYATGDTDVTITAGKESSAKWTNEYRNGYFTLLKNDDEGDPLAGIEFGVYDDKLMSNLLEVLVTDENGFAQSKEYTIPLTGRTVYVKELKTDAEHVMGTQPKLFEVVLSTEEPAKVNDGDGIINKKIYGRIGVLKTGETLVGYEETETEFGKLRTPKFEQVGLKGVTFLVFKEDDVKVSEDKTEVTYDAAKAVCKLVSDGGEVFTPNLPLGTYVVVEHEVPEGFVKVPYVGTTTLAKVDEEKEIVVQHLSHKNKQANTCVSVYKEAEVMVTTKSGERIATTVQIQPGEGFVFGVFADQDFETADDGILAKDSMVAIGATNVDGRIDFTSKLPLGKYRIKELKTKDGYIIDETEYPVDLEAKDGETLVKVMPTADNESIVNRLKKKPITITKKSLLGDEPLAGTQIQVYDEEGHVIFDQITGEDGTIPEFFALYGRSYTFKEIYAPNGFAIFTHVLSFSVTEDGEVEGVTELKDDYVRLKLLKVDEEGNPLPGVEFTLFDKEELPIQVRVTGEDGTVEFTQIPYGDYVVVETKPAEGMALADFKKELHVDGTWDNDSIEIIKVVNHPEEKTGEPVPFTMWAIFIILLCGVFGWGTATLANKYCTKEYVMTEEALFGEKRS